MSKSIVPGSLSAVAKRDGQSLAESFLSADAIVIVDVSGSMDSADVETPEGLQRRYKVAVQELTKLQATLPGKVAVVAFSSSVEFCPGGVPPFRSGGTDLAGALHFVHAADDTGVRLIVISDGAPNDPAAALTQARQFVSPIDVIYVGPEGGEGAEFLRRLAKASSGSYGAQSLAQLSDSVQRLMLAAGR